MRKVSFIVIKPRHYLPAYLWWVKTNQHIHHIKSKIIKSSQFNQNNYFRFWNLFKFSFILFVFLFLFYIYSSGYLTRTRAWFNLFAVFAVWMCRWWGRCVRVCAQEEGLTHTSVCATVDHYKKSISRAVTHILNPGFTQRAHGRGGQHLQDFGVLNSF